MTWKPKKHELLALLPETLVITRTRDARTRYLSFDDGPEPQHTPKLLDTLAKHGVKASFFLVGEKIEQHPEIVQRIVAEGHMIGNHSYSHWSFRNMNLTKQLDEVYRTDALLRRF
ncbi:MAG: polysaccharide deacetylase family protein, partial [Luteibacter sp.]